jgi:hypothetical protein
MPDAQVAFGLRRADGLEVTDEFREHRIPAGERKAQGSRARASLAVVVVFFIVFSSGKWRRGGHRRPSSFRLRRAGFLPAPVDGAAGSDESVGTEPAVGGRRLLVLYRIEIPATELKICGRRTGSVL